MRILNLTNRPWMPSAGQRLVVDHSTLAGLASGLSPGEAVVLRVRGEHALASVLRVGFGLDDTTYELQVGRPVAVTELAGLGAVEAPRRVWGSEDVMAALCRLKRTQLDCEETCVHCVLNPDSDQGRQLLRAARETLHAVLPG